MKSAISKFLSEEEGLTIVEYAIGGALIVAAGVAVFTNLGTAVKTRINAIITALGGTTA